jgi:acetylornithine deacetylase
MERRTVSGESEAAVMGEVNAILERLRIDDPEFDATTRLIFGRPAYAIDSDHRLCQTLGAAIGRAGRSPRSVGASFWTDAAILADAGIPSVLFGPGGAGLHSIEEFVEIDEVTVCRDVLIDVTRTLVAGGAR